eukprot:TRINITY_DN9298_c0_g1_i2.p1 TRINITY_DN9298_c0_g1~~TRINITY_DN9298_c0_g1_i2.p1  ORF type:complete len:504 (+),score=118.96 TRINITY_DN9298_c0_g1_i2:91-1602(+)
MAEDEKSTSSVPGEQGASAMFADNNLPQDDYDDLLDLSRSVEPAAGGAPDPKAAANNDLDLTQGPDGLAVALEDEDVVEDVPPPEAVVVEDQEESRDVWADHDKHVFILSNAGKPIYTRHGNEEKLVTLMGVMQALTSFIEDDKDQLRWFQAGQHRFVFLQKDPLHLVMIAKTGESHSHLAIQLNYVYNQIISVLTRSQLDRIFEQRSNFDLRRLLVGTDKFTDQLVDAMGRDASYFLSAVRCLRMPQSHRDKIGQIINQAKHKDMLFGVLVADGQLVTIVRSKKYSLPPQDILIIMNLVSTSDAFKAAETWFPLCLPKFNSTGFLHAHVSYIDDACKACLLLISTRQEAFYNLAMARATIVKTLSSQGCLSDIAEALRKRRYQVSSIDIPQLRHFIYKNRSTAQFTTPSFEGPYVVEKHATRVMRNYQHVHHMMHVNARPLKILYYAQEDEITLGWITDGFELFATFDPLTGKPAAIEAVLELIQWMKREESSLFILNAQTF